MPLLILISAEKPIFAHIFPDFAPTARPGRPPLKPAAATCYYISTYKYFSTNAPLPQQNISKFSTKSLILRIILIVRASMQALWQVKMGANGFDRIAECLVACPGYRLAWLIIRCKFNWQLPVAYGCLIERPVLPRFACGRGKGVNQQAG
jgi:hypothetical protein